MKHQEVTVDYWTMVKTMFFYGALTALCWIMLRLFHTVFTMPRRFRSQQENVQHTLQELQRRFPDLNVTEDLKDAEKELDEYTKVLEAERKEEIPIDKIPEIIEPPSEEVKKNI